MAHGSTLERRGAGPADDSTGSGDTGASGLTLATLDTPDTLDGGPLAPLAVSDARRGRLPEAGPRGRDPSLARELPSTFVTDVTSGRSPSWP
jgi:hypothetical protein